MTIDVKYLFRKAAVKAALVAIDSLSAAYLPLDDKGEGLFTYEEHSRLREFIRECERSHSQRE